MLSQKILDAAALAPPTCTSTPQGLGRKGDRASLHSLRDNHRTVRSGE
jgi:hypothetical protein